MFKDVDQAYNAWESKHGHNYHDPDNASAAFDRTSPRIRGEIHMTGTRTDREGRLKIYEKHRTGKKHYQAKMKALDKMKK